MCCKSPNTDARIQCWKANILAGHKLWKPLPEIHDSCVKSWLFVAMLEAVLDIQDMSRCQGQPSASLFQVHSWATAVIRLWKASVKISKGLTIMHLQSYLGYSRNFSGHAILQPGVLFVGRQNGHGHIRKQTCFKTAGCQKELLQSTGSRLYRFQRVYCASSRVCKASLLG